jgi:hypothetical protein
MSTRPERTDRVMKSHLWKAVIVGMVAMISLAGCSGQNSDQAASPTDFPGTEDGAKALLTKLIENEADRATMTRALRPTDADYEAIFVPEAAAKAKTGYAGLWGSSNTVIKPKEGQTALLLWNATSADIKAWQGSAAREFPGGWKGVGASLQDGLTFYRFKFVKPGETLGMAFDGLVHVNGHWVWAPKPYRVLR